MSQKQQQKKKKFTTTPLWQLLSNGKEPIVKKTTFPVPPMKASDKTAEELIKEKAEAGDIRGMKWLLAAWMPQDPVVKQDLLKGLKEAGVELSITFKGYERTVAP